IREDFLTEQGLAERRGQRVVLARNLMKTLREMNLDTAGKALQEQSGQHYHPVRGGQTASGIYRGSVQLASGKFAILEGDKSFSLVPWKPLIEQKVGQRLSAFVHGSSVTWHYA